MTELELCEMIASLEEEVECFRAHMNLLKKELIDVETDFCQKKIRLDELAEELRILQARKIVIEKSAKEIEIESFRERLPELLKKV